MSQTHVEFAEHDPCPVQLLRQPPRSPTVTRIEQSSSTQPVSQAHVPFTHAPCPEQLPLHVSAEYVWSDPMPEQSFP